MWDSQELDFGIKSSDLRRRDVRDLVCDLDAGLDPNEVRGTRPISMSSLDLRFIILGDKDPEHQSEHSYQHIFYNIRSTLPPPALPLHSSPACDSRLFLIPSSTISLFFSQWILSGA
jgi:hypothetical protein